MKKLNDKADSVRVKVPDEWSQTPEQYIHAIGDDSAGWEINPVWLAGMEKFIRAVVRDELKWMAQQQLDSAGIENDIACAIMRHANQPVE